MRTMKRETHESIGGFAMGMSWMTGLLGIVVLILFWTRSWPEMIAITASALGSFAVIQAVAWSMVGWTTRYVVDHEPAPTTA